MSIYIGTCGFAYPDWDGHFYPPGMPARDRLGYYAERFRAVELDSAFYHLPRPETLEKMAKRTPKEFRFTIKAHQSITHGFDLAAAEFGAFRKAVAPLAAAGKLGAVLAQFPPAFQCTRDSVHVLREIRAELHDLPLAIEFRHRSWNRPETFEFLRKHALIYCAVDEPTLDGLMPPVVARTAETVYIRLHGRNSAKWLNARTAAERHNYLYTDDELQEWADRIQRTAEEAREVYVLFSNVYEAKAIANARRLSEMLGLPTAPARRRQEPDLQRELTLT